MPPLHRALLLSLAAVAAVGCGGAKRAVTMPDSAPLAIPPAPARVVIPAAPDAPPTVPDASAPPATPPSGAVRTGRDASPVKPPVPPLPAATPPTMPPATPPAPSTLETPGDFEQRARRLKSSADELLKKIDYKTLSADGKAQYDSAKRFLDQAESALKAKNVLYAWQLADKANTIATLLHR